MNNWSTGALYCVSFASPNGLSISEKNLPTTLASKRPAATNKQNKIILHSLWLEWALGSVSGCCEDSTEIRSRKQIGKIHAGVASLNHRIAGTETRMGPVSYFRGHFGGRRRKQMLFVGIACCWVDNNRRTLISQLMWCTYHAERGLYAVTVPCHKYGTTPFLLYVAQNYIKIVQCKNICHRSIASYWNIVSINGNLSSSYPT